MKDIDWEAGPDLGDKSLVPRDDGPKRGGGKLNARQVESIRRRARQGETYTVIAQDYDDVVTETVRAAAKGRTYQWVDAEPAEPRDV